MTKKLSDDDKALFRRMMKGVTPLGAPPAPNTTTPTTQERHSPHQPRYLRIRSEFTGEQSIEFAQPGLQQRLLKRFSQGKLGIDAKLDLHNLVTEEAIEALDDFILEGSQNHWRCVLIIHGKGYSGKTGSARLKNLVYDYAVDHKKVLALHSAIGKHGGTGASYLLLKQTK